MLSSCLNDWRSTQNGFAVHWWTAIDVLPRADLETRYKHVVNFRFLEGGPRDIVGRNVGTLDNREILTPVGTLIPVM
jgi:hypothetical protein